jgi:hypothetical protein
MTNTNTDSDTGTNPSAHTETETSTRAPEPPSPLFSPDDGIDVVLVKAYQGEVLGEALFGGIAEQLDDADHAAKMRVLENLERCTKEAVAPALERAGITTDADPATIATAEALLPGALGIPWDELMATFGPITAQFIPLYRRIGELDPSEQVTADLLVAHEAALRDFAEAELAGDQDSLRFIDALAHVH